jgi:tyrosinase
MAVIRRNVLNSPHAQRFADGAIRLAGRSSQVTPNQLNGSSIVQQAPGARIFGTAAELARALSWWDLFTWWHVAAMTWPTPGGGNRAHGGPVFAPWHRLYLRRLEQAIQSVTGDATFGLPYWDWSTDGQLAPAAQLSAPIWSRVGPPQGPITTGPFGALRIRLLANPADNRIYVVPARPISRAAGQQSPRLPDLTDQRAALLDGTFDRASWDRSADSFRNKLEGWQDPREAVPPRQSPWMHNRVHVFVGGSMLPGSSPNDPVFFLNHCNVDRIWEGWLTQRGRTYVPGAGQGPPGHRINDPLLSIAWPSMTAAQVLDPAGATLDWYRYDSLPTPN